MSYDDIENLWRSPENNPTPSEMERQRAEFVSRLRREYLGFKLRMALIFGGLSWITGKLIHRIATQGPLQLPREKSIDLASEWALIPFLALPWVAAILFVRLHLKHRRSHPDFDQSIPATIRAMVDSTRLAIKRLRIMVGLSVLGVPILAFCIIQIHHAGKIHPNELTSVAALFSAIFVITFGCFAIGYFRDLLPRKRRLEELMASYI